MTGFGSRVRSELGTHDVSTCVDFRNRPVLIHLAVAQEPGPTVHLPINLQQVIAFHAQHDGLLQMRSGLVHTVRSNTRAAPIRGSLASREYKGRLKMDMRVLADYGNIMKTCVHSTNDTGHKAGLMPGVICHRSARPPLSFGARGS